MKIRLMMQTANSPLPRHPLGLRFSISSELPPSVLPGLPCGEPSHPADMQSIKDSDTDALGNRNRRWRKCQKLSGEEK